MDYSIIVALLNNAALLVMLTVVFDASYHTPKSLEKYRLYLLGFIFSFICIAIMSVPFVFESGIVFDTRTILISTVAYYWGMIPTFITVLVSVAFRLYKGGAGAIAGVVTIITSAFIGYIWRTFMADKFRHFKYLNIYVMSVLVHIVVIIDFLLIPNAHKVILVTGIPIMFIYPLVSIALSYIIMYRQTLRESQILLKESEDRFKRLFEEAPMGYQSLNENGYIIDVNERWTEIMGYSKQEVIGHWFGEFMPINLQTNFLESFPHFKEQGYVHTEVNVLNKNGKRLILEIDGRISTDQNGHFKQTHCIVQDITLRKKAENELKESERSKAVFLSNLPGMAYRCNNDENWTMKFVSEGAYTLTGYHPDELIDNKQIAYNDVISLDYQQVVKDEWDKAVAQQIAYKGEYEIVTKTGQKKWVLEWGEPIYNDQNEIIALEGIIIDISDRKDLETEIQYSNSHYALTGLHNLRFLKSILESESLKDIQATRAIVGVNLNNINFVSRQYGYSFSQQLIIKVAKHLSEYVNPKIKLFHTSENAFAFYVKEYKDMEELNYFCDTLVEMLETILVSERFNVGIGILELKKNTKINIDESLKNILLASEKAMEMDHRISYCFYNEEFERNVIRELSIQHELEAIINSEKGEGLMLNFQPIMDIQTNKIHGFEALARIESNHFGVISPLEFIPIAEKTKLIIALGEHITTKAFEFINRLKYLGHDHLVVSINVSLTQLMSEHFAKRFVAKITDMNVDPQNIEIEVTESVFASNNLEVNQVLADLKRTGISIAIDDFGTGYSSLSRERDLMMDVLKIDQSFIRRLKSEDDMDSITSDIISIAHKLNHTVIAEGVENQFQLDYLTKHSCDKVQGYLFSKPLKDVDAIAFLKDNL